MYLSNLRYFFCGIIVSGFFLKKSKFGYIKMCIVVKKKVFMRAVDRFIVKRHIKHIVCKKNVYLHKYNILIIVNNCYLNSLLFL